MDQANVSSLLSVGMHEMDGVEESYAAEYPEMNQDTSQGTTKFDIVMATSAMYTDHINTDSCLDEYHMSGIQPLEEIRFGSGEHFKPHSEEMVADSEEENNSSSPDTSSPTNYDMPGYVDQDLQHIYNAYDAMVDKEGLVILSPAFIICGETSHLEPHLTFSSDGIKIEYLDLDSFEDEKMVSSQWEISNIVSISCKWSQSIGSAFITLLAGSEAETRNSEPVTVQFCLDDSQWPRKQQKIWDIGARYQEIWKDIPSDDFASGNWSIEPSLFFPRQYFSSTADFEDVIYPKGDRDAVSISKRDADLLLPETFVNDTIIDFYVKFLSTRIESSEKHRYHFFNSFFFRKLADLDKDQGRAPEGRAAFLRVRKWTQKINVFEKDFLFIPVNFNLHWSLIVICYPGEVATFEDGETKVSAKVPCILHMDSLKGSHTGLKDIIQSYLWEEWKERHPESASDNSDKFLNLRFVSLELPQQDNSFDCGLFLLHYVELFLMDVPSNFNPLKIDAFSGFLSDDWFAPAEASLKRSVVWKLIHELVTGSFQNHPKLPCRSEQIAERHQRSSNAEREPAEERCSASEPESACTIHDGTHEIQPSTSICLNDSKEKGPPSGCMLETGTVSLLDVQNLKESGACAPDKDTVVFFSIQDEKNEPLLAQSNDIAGQEHSLHTTPEVGDECFRPPQVMDSDMMLDSRKDDIGPHPERATTKGDFGDPCEDKFSVRLDAVNKDVTVTKCEGTLVDPMTAGNAILENANEISMTEDRLVDPMTAENAIIENANEISTTKDRLVDPMTTDNAIIENEKEISMTEDSLVDPIPAENAIIENTKEISTMDLITAENAIIKNLKEISTAEDSLVDPMTVENATIENVEEISRTDPITVENTTIENGKDISMSVDNVNHIEQYVSSELPEENAGNDVTGDSSELKAGNTDNGMAGDDTVSSDLNEENIDKPTAGDCTNETDITANDDNLGFNMENTGSGMTGGNTVSSDFNEENADHIVTCDCRNETNVNDAVDKSLAPDGAVTCEDDTTCSDAAIASIDGPCSMKNEPVSKNTSSDGKRPVPEEGIDTPGDKCIQRDDAQGTDAKIERHYKRRKVLALEKQQSFSGGSSLD